MYPVFPNIDPAMLLKFRNTFDKTLSQEKSRIATSSAIKYVPSDGKAFNWASIGTQELTEITGQRNPDRVLADYELMNRIVGNRRFTKSIILDKSVDLIELIQNPTSVLYERLKEAFFRVQDRVIVSSAVGAVLIGAPDGSTPTVSITAAADGVRTVDATAGLTNAKIQEVTKVLNNNEMEDSAIRGSIICTSGNEKAVLMDDDHFIRSNYGPKRLDSGTIEQFGLYGITTFAGNETGAGSTIVPNPILPEDGGVRTNVVLTPQSMLFAYNITRFDVTPVDSKVNSISVNIDLIMKCMRREGKRIVILTTTI